MPQKEWPHTRPAVMQATTRQLLPGVTGCRCTCGGLEGQAGGMLRQTIDMLSLRESQVKGDGLWAICFAVLVSLEGLFPPTLWVSFLQSKHCICWGRSLQIPSELCACLQLLGCNVTCFVLRCSKLKSCLLLKDRAAVPLIDTSSCSGLNCRVTSALPRLSLRLLLACALFCQVIALLATVDSSTCGT